MPITGQDLIVNRAKLSETQTVQSIFPDTPEDGQCLLRIDHFALTANNITYAVAPDAMGYWNFFPSDQGGFGRVPVWGYAEVIASAHPQIATGTRVYGYLPMSTHLMIQPGKINPFGMTDMVPHRQDMSPIYNQYSFTESLGCYDEVITYDAIETLPKTKTAFIDMAGDAGTIRRSHGHFDEHLTNS